MQNLIASRTDRMRKLIMRLLWGGLGAVFVALGLTSCINLFSPDEKPSGGSPPSSQPATTIKDVLTQWSKVDTTQAKVDHDLIVASFKAGGDAAAEQLFRSLSDVRREAVALAFAPVKLVGTPEGMNASEVQRTTSKPPAQTAAAGQRGIRFSVACYDLAGSLAFTWYHEVIWNYDGSRVTYGYFNPYGSVTNGTVYKSVPAETRKSSSALGQPTWYTNSNGTFTTPWSINLSIKGFGIQYGRTWHPYITAWLTGSGGYSWSYGCSAG